jgi:hypothetical protein
MKKKYVTPKMIIRPMPSHKVIEEINKKIQEDVKRNNRKKQ